MKKHQINDQNRLVTNTVVEADGYIGHTDIVRQFSLISDVFVVVTAFWIARNRNFRCRSILKEEGNMK